ncbi:hypothetical protein FQN49_002220 [Arthroderma sp. PD_2]|nr:hypothetical protein FQN49_002220 [Arthroderma sp. PD_2]
MAYHRLGSLENYNFSTQESLEVVHQCLKALEYLEYKTIFHRDIKEDNILMKSASPLFVCLADFGIAVTRNEGAVHGGQLSHVAIEVYQGGRFTYICDIWSLGVTALYLLDRFPRVEAQCFHARNQDPARVAVYYSKLLSEASSLPGHIGGLVNNMICAPVARWTAARCLRYLEEGANAEPLRRRPSRFRSRR